MKVKSLLTVACLAATMSASAVYPLQFRDAGGKANGTMDYPVVEGTETDTYYGDPLFNEDGSITLTSNENAMNGMWFRTVKVTEVVPEEYNILAYEYKSNRTVPNVCLIPQEGWNNAGENQAGASAYAKTDEYETMYISFPRAKYPGWGDGTKGYYFWVSCNAAEGKTAGWELTVKNLRLLTNEEAAAECNAAASGADLEEAFWIPNTDLVSDTDPDMEGATMYVRPENVPNPLLWSSNMIKPLPESLGVLTFEYKLYGPSFAPYLWLTANNLGKELFTFEGTGEGETLEDVYNMPWKVAKIDFKEKINEFGWAKKFASNDFLQIQCLDMTPLTEDNDGNVSGNQLWIRNPKWTKPNTTGVAEIGVAERPADNRVYNIMGVEVKGELAPGLYIRNGKKFIVK